jgi:single-stranded-DNA-specific exonuclease
MVSARRADFGKIAKACGISPVLARLIRNRGAVGEHETEQFLRGTLDDLRDPSLLPDIRKGAGIIMEAIRSGAKIRVIGDYDVDGICSSYILWRTITMLGGRVDAVLPDRIRDGYGINERLVCEAAKEGITLIVTCDNGIAAAQPLQTAMDKGIRVVVTDHHEIPYTCSADGSKWQGT